MSGTAGERLRVVYVMGYGRSGSTLLERILGSHPGVTSAGELFDLPAALRASGLCSCRRRLAECPSWAGVIVALREAGLGDWARLERLARAVESRHRLPAVLAGRLPADAIVTYRAYADVVFGALAARSGARIIVDASKSARHAAGRVLALARFTTLDLRPVLLVRDARAVAASCMAGGGSPERKRRGRWALVRGARGLAGWAITNATALLLRRLGDGHALIIRYEDLVQDPRTTLEMLGAHAGLDLRHVIAAIEAGRPLAPQHTIGGNRVRFENAIRVRADGGARAVLPWPLRPVHALVARPVARWLDHAMEGDRVHACAVAAAPAPLTSTQTADGARHIV